VRQTALDGNCPNVLIHRQGRRSSRHPITKLEFQQMIQQQLGKDLDHDCEPLGKQGTGGALFRITLAEWGYTLVGKGTVEAFVPDLQHEGQIYQRLDAIQGECIPVYLGNIDLLKVYYLDIGVRIQHMLMMSWIGERADVDREARNHPIQTQVRLLVKEVGRLGVVHGDIGEPNILWSRELRRVMLIDFERATCATSSRLNWSPARDRWILRELSTNRRGKRSKTCEHTEKSTKQDVLVICRVASLHAALTSLANPAESATGLESTSGYICMMILVTKVESRSRQISLRRRHVCLYTLGVRSIALARSSKSA
jgi:hypothetical protein